MKTVVVPVLASLFFPIAFTYADDKIDYEADHDDKGRVCAKVEYETMQGWTRKAKQCHKVSTWQKLGYDVTFIKKDDKGEEVFREIHERLPE